ncbi:PLP-dependent aminotransferase family protein [Streptomyces sp. CBMA152]|uniref:aminotransferase-like domain-containing protein n=1 Tax=Streptomyces sp. CBMA152 TaxID=1896312 RepID=UPI00166091AC|nr:PLP-dependent aminotransferase family protein [Streptomyces sp. CBMA152]MBD0744038.1 GntR family transcriptional regulator [Streptomyces sp. CBMA152]
MTSPVLLDRADLHASLADPALVSMTFLNEVAGRYPDAISFAPGRPTEETFDLADLHRYLDAYARHLAEHKGYDEARVRRELFQYGRTKGVVHELIARQLELDEGITVDPEAVVVTVGAQEALWLVLRALKASERDVVLAVTPTYVGLTGAARLLDLPVRPVPEGPDGVRPEDLIERIRAVRAAGERPRALYLVPDFSNPSGHSLDLTTRHRLLEIAAEEDILLLEDNPYGYFRAEGERPPTLKALDTKQRVVYLGSLAKTCFPGARVGFAVADQKIAGADGGLLADELARAKSMVTVNTSPVSQALVGGMLLEHGGSLLRANERPIAVYRRNLDCLLKGLDHRFSEVPGVSWNTPAGGFFVVVTVPFPVTDALLEEAAVRHGVLFTPMRHFGDDARSGRQLRLSCSYLTTDQIESGLDRLAALIAEHTQGAPDA